MRLPFRKPGKFTNLTNDPHLTQEKFNELKKKLDSMKASQPGLAAEVSRLSELGDFSENAEYQMAKGRLRGLITTMIKLETHLNQAIIIKPGTHNEVRIGGRVTVDTGKAERTYLILGSSETDPSKNIISYTSPIGAALLGHRVGDVITISRPEKDIIFKILKIE